MLAQALLSIALIIVIIWIGMKFIVKPYLRKNEIDLENLIQKKKDLETKRLELQAMRQEVEVTFDLKHVEDEIKLCAEEIKKLEKKRGRRKRTNESKT